MTLDPRLERALPNLLADLGSGGPTDYAETLLARTARTRQRPAWSFPERWLPMDVPATRLTILSVRWRLIALALLLIAALVGGAILVASGNRARLPLLFGPAPNGAIAYTTNGDIVAADPVTGASHPLVAGPTFDFRGGYSQDGSQLAFLRRVVADEAGATELWVADASGANAHAVTTAPLIAEPRAWNWAPDGSSIAVVTSDGVYEVFDLRGGPPKVADLNGVKMSQTPAFQPPTGDHVLFRGETGTQIGLYVMNADGTNLHPVVGPYESPTGTEEDLREPVWAPDGASFVYQRVTPSVDSMRLVRADADGRNLRPVGDEPADAWDGYPRVSPDGTQVLFVRSTQGSLGYSWAVVDLATNVVRPIGPTISTAVDSGTHWSPDARSVLLLIFDGSMAKEIDVATGQVTQFTWTGDGADWQRGQAH